MIFIWQQNFDAASFANLHDQTERVGAFLCIFIKDSYKFSKKNAPNSIRFSGNSKIKKTQPFCQFHWKFSWLHKDHKIPECIKCFFLNVLFRFAQKILTWLQHPFRKPYCFMNIQNGIQKGVVPIMTYFASCLSLSFPAFKTLVTLSVRSGFSQLLLCFVILIKTIPSYLSWQ